MLVKRKGTYKNYGATVLFDDERKVSVSWNKKEPRVELTVKQVRDPNGNSHHNYLVSLSLEKIAKIISVLSEQGLVHSSEQIAARLPIRDLLRLLVSSSGLPSNDVTKS